MGNVTGTLTEQPAQWALAAQQVGAVSVFDATHFAPHRRIDVKALGCDFLVCSLYKFFGPHMGAMYGSKEALMKLNVPRVRPSMDALPDEETCQMSKWELGTPNYESLAGAVACVEYMARFGIDAIESSGSLSEQLDEGLWRITQYEKEISRRFLEGFSAIPGVHLFGHAMDTSQPMEKIVSRRTPTFAFCSTLGIPSATLASRLNSLGVYCTAGNHYAPGLVHESFALPEDGCVRTSFMHYNTFEEVDFVLEKIAASARLDFQ